MAKRSAAPSTPTGQAGDDAFALKNLLSAPRTPETAGTVANALITEKLWVAVGRTDAGPGIAEARTAEGDRLVEVYSHPLEVIALGRGNDPAPIAPAGLANVLRTNPELSGVVVNPGGPWIRLSREELAPLLALATQD
ncbi:SseB family protein [Microbacterium sp. BWT-B31]|uniref:SseB family protein n=1 Tax=Microbacterium sp. BWT-B31 TaxID=3232072 RepID=UPI0035283C7F